MSFFLYIHLLILISTFVSNSSLIFSLLYKQVHVVGGESTNWCRILGEFILAKNTHNKITNELLFPQNLWIKYHHRLVSLVCLTISLRERQPWLQTRCSHNVVYTMQPFVRSCSSWRLLSVCNCIFVLSFFLLYKIINICRDMWLL